MNDTRNRLHEPAVGRKTETTPNDRPDTRRRWSRLLFGGGAFLLLAVGLAFGTSRSYSQQREVIATADHAREFVPSVRVAIVGASPGNIVVTFAGNDGRVRGREHLCSRHRLYRKAQR